MPNFALLGVGYIAKRHIEAIEQTNNTLKMFYDVSLDVLEEPYQHVVKAESEDKFYASLNEHKVDFVSICSPSFLHYKQIVKAFENGCNVIVEKPICLTIEELNHIQELEQKTGLKAFSLFQLRYNPLFEQFPVKQNNTIEIVYQGKRNEAYYNSWKGNLQKSGGITSAVGIHYFDLLTKKYGSYISDSLVTEVATLKHVKGTFSLETAEVQFNFEFLPQETEADLQRKFLINGEEFDFSAYQTNLHTNAYQEILNGRGVNSNEAMKSLQIVDEINERLV